MEALLHLEHPGMFSILCNFFNICDSDRVTAAKPKFHINATAILNLLLCQTRFYQVTFSGCDF